MNSFWINSDVPFNIPSGVFLRDSLEIPTGIGIYQENHSELQPRNPDIIPRLDSGISTSSQVFL